MLHAVFTEVWYILFVLQRTSTSHSWSRPKKYICGSYNRRLIWYFWSAWPREEYCYSWSIICWSVYILLTQHLLTYFSLLPLFCIKQLAPPPQVTQIINFSPFSFMYKRRWLNVIIFVLLPPTNNFWINWLTYMKLRTNIMPWKVSLLE